MSWHLLHAAALVVAAATPAAETVDGPVYKSWAKSKVGTAVTIKSVTVMKGVRVDSTLRYELVELTPEKAVVDTVVTTQGVAGRPLRAEHRRAFPLLPGVKKEDIGKPPAGSEQGLETLEVLGKDYETQWYVMKGRVEAGEVITRSWTNPDFPGMLLKSIIKVPAADKVTTLEVLEFKQP